MLLHTALLLPVTGAEEVSAWRDIAKSAPAGLLAAASPKRSALFFSTQSTGKSVVPFLGFFIGGDGLALSALAPLQGKVDPGFKLGDENANGLPKPAVLAVFPDQELALVKFAFKPKTWLTLSREPAPPLGTWVAVLSPQFGPDPVAAPILAFRSMSHVSKWKPWRMPPKQFSLATGRNPANEKVFVEGAPLLNARGEVVAVFSGSQPLPDQTFRSACPLAGLQERIDEAVKKGGKLDLPLTAETLQLDPAAASEDFRLMDAALMKQDLAQARLHAKALIAAFPNSLFAQCEEYSVAALGVNAGEVKAEDLIELAK